eukprot:TRINITY_DN10367_c0_g1_i1.p1 TRINITY_DN10367_c0_g1~~TRINITY_DN10367_c0_g1_i1.p1  ORF type:complete len:374 (+),score=164.81 TRINITY_DN10367_c0_g1_i1:1-1122(+)
MASFVRQLNMYGFRKVVSVDAGALKGEKEEVEFAHNFFIQGQEYLLEHIKRKVNNAARSDHGIKQEFIPSLSSEKVNEVLVEVGQLKDRQEDMDGRLDAMKNENEALWGEVMNLRLRYSQQQKTVNKLIQFLSALVKPRGRKRAFQARLGGAGHLALQGSKVGVKQARVEEQLHTGPVIKEIGEQLSLQEAVPSYQQLDGDVQAALLSQDGLSHPQLSQAVDQVQLLQADLPGEGQHLSGHMQDVFMMVSDDNGQEQELRLTPARLKENLGTDINSMQNELDNLKDILSGQITLDTSLMSDLFGQDLDFPNMNILINTPVNLEEDVEQEDIPMLEDSCSHLTSMTRALPDHDYAEGVGLGMEPEVEDPLDCFF